MFQSVSDFSKLKVRFVLTSSLLLLSASISQGDSSTPENQRRSAREIRIEQKSDRCRASKQAAILYLEGRDLPLRGADWEVSEMAGDRPLYDSIDNASAAISINVPPLYQSPFNLTGRGFVVGIWEPGMARVTHRELSGRLQLASGQSAARYDHSTHVAGTIAGAGLNARARGMAPEATLLFHDWNNDAAELESAGANQADGDGILVSNHSYGTQSGWKKFSGTGPSGRSGWHWFGTWGDSESRLFGQYTDRTADFDHSCYHTPYLLPFKSAGNDRDDNPPAGTTIRFEEDGEWKSTLYNPRVHPEGDGEANGGYDTIPTYASAKNVVTVGSVDDALSSNNRDLNRANVSAFSNWGPTDDGRIKPDLMANGLSVYSAWGTGDADYRDQEGTSMACPGAAGGAILLQQLHQRLFGKALRASGLKALLLHTADDLGRTGPDYQSGWGLMNVEAAAGHLIRLSENHNRTGHMEDSLASGRSNQHTLDWNARRPLKLTLVWTDPAGRPSDALDRTTPQLIHDLDLRLESPSGEISLPFTVDQSRPERPATAGDNHRDNIEQIILAEATPGRYLIRISHKGTLSSGGQFYNLMVSDAGGESEETDSGLLSPAVLTTPEPG
ncbi:MAG: S8 family serine peptidase, partial [Verrucomicrobiota bacterium]